MKPLSKIQRRAQTAERDPAELWAAAVPTLDAYLQALGVADAADRAAWLQQLAQRIAPRSTDSPQRLTEQGLREINLWLNSWLRSALAQRGTAMPIQGARAALLCTQPPGWPTALLEGAPAPLPAERDIPTTPYPAPLEMPTQSIILLGQRISAHFKRLLHPTPPSNNDLPPRNAQRR